jgi:AcrR family transcriptional regulator
MSTLDLADSSLTPAGERIVTAAAALFYDHGIRATGVDAIADAAGTTKKTLYDRFGSKDALVALYLARRARAWQAMLEERLATEPPGVGRVLAVFDAIAVWSVGSVRGCAFVNAYAELGGTENSALPIIRAEKAWMRDRFTALIAEAGCADAERLGVTVHLLYEGALVTWTAGGDPAALESARASAESVLRTLG